MWNTKSSMKENTSDGKARAENRGKAIKREKSQIGLDAIRHPVCWSLESGYFDSSDWKVGTLGVRGLGGRSQYLVREFLPTLKS